MKKIFVLGILLSIALSAFSQELNFNVKINTQKLQTVDPKVFETLEQTIREFLNSQKWTDDIFETEERITCNLVLTIQEEKSPTSFKADLAIQASRPIFNSSMETPIFNHLDRDVEFEYNQFDPIIYSKNSYNGNLSSILAYYAYIILGSSYDTFAPLGGQDFFQLAEEASNNVPRNPSPPKGWGSTNTNKNRYWLVENLLSPRVKAYRLAMYRYHLKGIDLIADDIAGGRANIAAAFDDIAKVNQAYPNCMVLQVFNATKSSEIIEIFKPAPLAEQTKVVRTMTSIDPSNAAKYRKIKK